MLLLLAHSNQILPFGNVYWWLSGSLRVLTWSPCSVFPSFLYSLGSSILSFVCLNFSLFLSFFFSSVQYGLWSLCAPARGRAWTSEVGDLSRGCWITREVSIPWDRISESSVPNALKQLAKQEHKPIHSQTVCAKSYQSEKHPITHHWAWHCLLLYFLI